MIELEVPSYGVARIKVIGVGGAGNNAINRLIDSNEIHGVDYIAVNTDEQALRMSKAPTKIIIGKTITRGLGAGSNPEVGKKSAEENKEEIKEAIKDSDMLFITAGMGGGTGTGAAPVVAHIARELGILTIGVVTKPFAHEKPKFPIAEKGIEALKEYVDSIVVIPNSNLAKFGDKKTSFFELLEMADEALKLAVQAIVSIITEVGVMNVDFADVRTALSNSGTAHMGVARAKIDKAEQATKEALSSKLIESDITSAKSFLITLKASSQLDGDTIFNCTRIITEEYKECENVKSGLVRDDDMGDEIIVTIIVAGFDDSVNKKKEESTSKSEKSVSAEQASASSDRKKDIDDSEFDIPDFLKR